MTPRMLISIATVGATLALGVPTAWGSGEPYRDHGDATQAKLASQSETPFVIVRDHGDATQAKLAAQSPAPASLVIVRDHGDATQAKLVHQSAPSITTERIRLAQERRLGPVAGRVVVSKVDSSREIEWPQVGVGLGIGILLALGLGLIGRTLRVRPFAH